MLKIQNTLNRAKHWLLFMVLIGFFMSIPPVGAQTQSDVVLTAQAGFNGYCKQNAWTPIHISIQNNGDNFEARVEAFYHDSVQSSDDVYAINISLPNSSRKEFFLYIRPRSFVRSLNIVVKNQGKVVANVPTRLTCVDDKTRIFGLLSDNPSAFGALNNLENIGGGTIRVSQLQIADLPDRAAGWQGLDGLLVAGVDTGTLSIAQKQNLKTWIASGGKIFVVGGTEWRKTAAGISDLLPVSITDTKNLTDFSAFQSFTRDSSALTGDILISVGTLQSDAHVLIEQDGTPLLVQKTIGFGEVYFFAADPAMQPLQDWDGMREIYRATLGSVRVVPTWQKQWESYTLNQALGTIPQLGVPSILFLCCWLTIYIVVVGPVNMLVLRRMKRRELAWVTIPILVIIFTGISYFSGALYRGATPILNRLAVAQAWDGVDQAQVRAVSGVYSPIRTSYTLESTDEFMLSEFEGASANLQSSSGFESEQTPDGMLMANVLVESSGLKTVRSDGYISALPIKHNLQIGLSKIAPRLTGTITNESKTILKDVILITAGDYVKIGDLKPNQTFTVNASIDPNLNGGDFYNLTGNDLLGTPTYPPPSDPELYRKTSFLNAILGNSGYSRNGNWGIYLMGWVDEPMIPVGIQDKKFDSIDTTLYFTNLSPVIKTEPEDIMLTPGLFRWESSDSNTSPYNVSQVPSGGYVLRFEPAAGIHFTTIKSLSLRVYASAAPQFVTISLWDIDRKEWIPQPSISWGANNISEPEHYINSSGEVQIKVESDSNQYVQITSTTITMMVKP